MKKMFKTISLLVCISLISTGLCGTVSSAAASGVTVTTDTAVVSKLSTNENLVYGYLPCATGLSDGTFTVAAKFKEGDYGMTGSGKYSADVKNNAITDGDITATPHTDIAMSNGTGYLQFVDGNNKYVENIYLDLIFDLKYNADINKIFLAWSLRENLRTYEYSVYAALNFDDLFKTESIIYDGYKNDKNDQCQTFSLSQSRKVKYVAVRIFKGVNTSKYNSGASSSNARVCEVGIFGVYDAPKFDYTFTSDKGSIVDESGFKYADTNLTLTAPLTKGGYSFKGITVNGNPVQCEIDNYSGTATYTTVVTEKITAVANYEDDPSVLTSKKYQVDSTKNIIRIPTGELAFEVIHGFDQYADNISVIWGGQAVTPGTAVKPGMKIQLSSKGLVRKQYSVKYSADLTGDGKITVTDAVYAANAIVSGNTEFYKSSGDINGDGLLTVTDLVCIDELLIKCTEPKDYPLISAKAADMDVKSIGRNYITKDGNVQMEWTSAGIQFKADCYGDVALKLFNYSGGEYYVSVVDGVESEVKVANNVDTEITVAKNLPHGMHTFEFYKQSEAGGGYLQFRGVKLNGSLCEAPENAPLLIEFCGDSITCGMGNLSPKGSAATGHHENGYLSYGSQTARMLGADWNNISHSGADLMDPKGDTRANCIPQEYENCLSSDKSIKYDFARKADIVVVNLGTNDDGLMQNFRGITDKETKISLFNAEAEKFVDNIVAKNGKNVKVVFAFGLMSGDGHFAHTAYKRLVEICNNKGYDTYYCKLPVNTDGGQGHPSVAGDTAAAEVLSKFIKDNVL